MGPTRKPQILFVEDPSEESLGVRSGETYLESLENLQTQEDCAGMAFLLWTKSKPPVVVLALEHEINQFCSKAFI